VQGRCERNNWKSKRYGHLKYAAGCNRKIKERKPGPMESIKDNRNTHTALVGTPEGMKQLGKHGNRREDQTGYFFYLRGCCVA
jgi:hypothetical protein